MAREARMSHRRETAASVDPAKIRMVREARMSHRRESAASVDPVNTHRLDVQRYKKSRLRKWTSLRIFAAGAATGSSKVTPIKEPVISNPT